MGATLEQLLEVRTVAQEEQSLLSVLQTEGFPVSEWRDGTAPRTLIKAIADGLSRVSSLAPQVAAGGILELSSGDWLDLAAQAYGLERAPATKTRVRVVVTCEEGLGPVSINPGFTVRARAAGLNRYIYQGEPVEIADGGEVELEVEAEEAGAKYADPAGTIRDLVTPQPGISVDNPVIPLSPVSSWGPVRGGTIVPSVSPEGHVPADALVWTVEVLDSGDVGVSGRVRITSVDENGQTSVFALVESIPATVALTDGVSVAFQPSGVVSPAFTAGGLYLFATRVPPILRAGADAESDLSLARRCRGRWPSLGMNPTTGTIENLIRSYSIEQALGIEKIVVRPSIEVAGRTDVTLATLAGDPGPQTIAAIQAHLDRQVHATESIRVLGARNKEVTATGQVMVRAGEAAVVQAAAGASWGVYLASLDIGGDNSTGNPGVVRLSELVQALMDAGAVDVATLQLNGAAANLALGSHEAPVVAAPLSQTLTWVPV